MKKLVMLFLATFIVVAGYSQTPSRCAPGDSSAKKCHGFGFQADITYNFIQLKPTEMKSFQVALMSGYHFCEYFYAGIGVVVQPPVFRTGLYLICDCKYTFFLI